MDLLKRYLHAVRFWLPAAHQDDILAELAEDLRSQIEDKEGELGRPLDEGEIAGILKRRGHPVMVASRYLPQQYLIGPALLPMYQFILKLVLLWVLVPVFLVIVGPVILFTSNDPGRALLNTFLELPRAAITAFGVITLVFAVLERFQGQARSGGGCQWDPRTLPRVPAEHRTSRITRWVGEIVMSLLWSLAWIYLVWFRSEFEFGNIRIALTPVWASFFWPILLTLLSGVAVGWVGLFRPDAIRLRFTIRATASAAGISLAAILLNAGPWLDVTTLALSAVAPEDLARWINIGVGITLVSIVIVTMIDVFQDVRRTFLRKQRSSPVGGLAIL